MGFYRLFRAKDIIKLSVDAVEGGAFGHIFDAFCADISHGASYAAEYGQKDFHRMQI